MAALLILRALERKQTHSLSDLPLYGAAVGEEDNGSWVRGLGKV